MRNEDHLHCCCRRRFLLRGACLAVAAAALPAANLTSRTVPGPVPLSNLSLAAFEGLLGASFKVRPAGGGILKLTLRKAQSLSFSTPPRAAGPRWEGFSLVFSGPSGQVLPQDTYSFEHEQVGRFDMFIVPIGQPPDGVPRYQAVFNRPV